MRFLSEMLLVSLVIGQTITYCLTNEIDKTSLVWQRMNPSDIAIATIQSTLLELAQPACKEPP
jgi:hypothetical protein